MRCKIVPCGQVVKDFGRQEKLGKLRRRSRTTFYRPHFSTTRNVTHSALSRTEFLLAASTRALTDQGSSMQEGSSNLVQCLIYTRDKKGKAN